MFPRAGTRVPTPRSVSLPNPQNRPFRKPRSRSAPRLPSPSPRREPHAPEVLSMPATLTAVAAKSAAGPESTVARTIDYAPHLKSNVGNVERWVSAGVGAALVANGALGRRL